MNEPDATVLFRRWFVAPIDKLRDLPDGDGGFVAFISGLALYERLIVARLKVKGESHKAADVKREIARDLALTEHDQSVFWDVFRNGLLHQAMPKAGKTNWIFHSSFGAKPIICTIDGTRCICIDPWKFTDHVLNEFLQNPNLINTSVSYPLPQILFDTGG